MARKFVFFVLLTLVVCAISISCSNKIVPGIYGTNYASYGMVGKTLTLNCDSSMILRFSGDFVNDYYYGKWTTSKDTLFFVFDTINNPNNIGHQNLLVRGKKLKDIPIPFNKKIYQELIEAIRSVHEDTLQLPSYRELKRNRGKILVDFKGTMKRQHFVRYEKFSCEE